MITAVLGISGGHLNPAVTIGLLVTRRIRVPDAAAYIAAQLIGAVHRGPAAQAGLSPPA